MGECVCIIRIHRRFDLPACSHELAWANIIRLYSPVFVCSTMTRGTLAHAREAQCCRVARELSFGRNKLSPVASLFALFSFIDVVIQRLRWGPPSCVFQFFDVGRSFAASHSTEAVADPFKFKLFDLTNQLPFRFAGC